VRESERNCAARSRQRAIGVVTTRAPARLRATFPKAGESWGKVAVRVGTGEERISKAEVVEPEGIRRIGDPTRGFRCD